MNTCRHCGKHISRTPAGWIHDGTGAHSCGPVAEPVSRTRKAKVDRSEWVMREALEPVVPLDGKRIITRIELAALHQHLGTLLGYGERP